MGLKLCTCSDNDIDNNPYKESKPKPITETNLSKIKRYCFLKQTNNIPKLEDEFRTKTGTEWKRMKGLEKIITLYRINLIIKRYREHLKKRKNEINNILK